MSIIKQLLSSAEDPAAYAAQPGRSAKILRATPPRLSVLQVKPDGLHLQKANEIEAVGAEADVIILGAEPGVGISRSCFSTEYKTGKQGPVCSSFDGVTPTTDTPVSPSCIGCPNSVWGTGPNCVGYACRPYKSLIVLLIFEDGRYQLCALRLYGRSLTQLNVYAAELEEAEADWQKVITHLSISEEHQGVVEFRAALLVDPGDFSYVEEQVEIYQRQYRRVK